MNFYFKIKLSSGPSGLNNKDVLLGVNVCGVPVPQTKMVVGTSE